ncbi:hypothetical protein F4778DRAFT_752372 [Xylariomycetidae sp. FL2044]|nr:hypothetical protein F4778DRAFT_752372 [Xylariomycetidae sp. FL2044]
MSSSSSAASTACSKPLSFMETLDPLVSVYRPLSLSPQARAPDDPAAPRLIVVASWTDARDAHIAKYVAQYRSLYPRAQILLLRSTMRQILRPSLIGASMRYAAEVVRASFPTSSSSSSSSFSYGSGSSSSGSTAVPPPMLIHMFSNGGSSSVANLYEQYAALAAADNNDDGGGGEDADRRRLLSTPLPPHATIFDSCPGVYSVSRSVAFFNVSLASPLQRLLAAPLLYAWACAWWVAIALGLIPDTLADWGRAHNQRVNAGSEVRRAYLYSARDALVDYRAVEAHAAEARAASKGSGGEEVIRLERFEGSAHVAHLRKDEGRYWGIVKWAVEG